MAIPQLFRPARAMILAAGRGERLRPLSDRLPKALIQAGGRSLIERLLEQLREAGVREVVVNLSWLGDMIRDRLGDGERHGVDIRYSDEGDSALETGGGILKALPLLGEAPFWVVNADIRTDFRFRPVRLAPECLAWLLLAPNPAHNPGGDFGLNGSQVVPGGVRHTFAGISVLRRGLFAGIGEKRFPLGALLRKAAAQGRVSGALYDGYWADAGAPERLDAVLAGPPASGGP